MVKQSLWLILVIMLLSACGGKAAPTLPSAQEAETALAEMPLPESEETLLAELPETSVPTELALPTPTILAEITQAVVPTYAPPTETILPTFTPLPTEIGLSPNEAPTTAALVPTQAPLSGESQILLSLIISGSLVPVEEVAVPVAEEAAQPKEVIIQPQARAAVRPGLGRLVLPGLTCLMGIIILGLGLYMTTSSTPTSQDITSVLNISDLKPQIGLVQLQGTITQVPRPLDKNADTPLAVLRLVIEENEPQVGWKVVLDRVLATEFSLEDGTGEVWVLPDQLDLNLLGEGSFASIKQAEEALKILGLQASSAWGRGLRYRIWELRKGQSLIALGNVQQQFKLTGSLRHPIALSPSAETVQTPTSEASSGRGVNGLLVLIIALGGAAFLGGLAWLLWALMR